jgi:phosphoribosylformylglycinamidine synthase
MILREQGVNSQIEMAAAFHRAGFQAVDVTMGDLRQGRVTWGDFRGMAVCGGFSFGDVLGAGSGWAHAIGLDPGLRDAFQTFFARSDTFTLGVCNGCQMLSQLQPLIPGSEGWPRFVRNRSEQFEARLAMVEIVPSPSILLAGMAGSIVPIPCSHGEGRVRFPDEQGLEALHTRQQVALRFVDAHDRVTERYPDNPNGSPRGITGVTTLDGRVTLMMPHPERAFRTIQYSWHPAAWGEDAPWLRLFRNARHWVS